MSNSRIIQSSQNEPFQHLAKTVAKHFQHPFLKEIGTPTREAFSEIQPFLESIQQPILLDSGCGTGESSEQLATLFPTHFVIGVDKSEHRLQQRNYLFEPDNQRNVLLIRSELVDFWRLLQLSSVIVEKHYLLYPNPWPKPKHFQRRWHGHPIFPVLLALGNHFELRSNWRLYLEEFQEALVVVGYPKPSIQELQIHFALTPFEKKYHASNQPLFSMCWNSFSFGD